jgi:FMN phosphatase YigB (HAD superfamily)
VPLAIFDLDNTLIDRAASFLQWAERFTDLRSLGPEEVAWLVRSEDGFAERPVFIAAVKQRYKLPGSRRRPRPPTIFRPRSRWFWHRRTNIAGCSTSLRCSTRSTRPPAWARWSPSGTS